MSSQYAPPPYPGSPPGAPRGADKRLEKLGLVSLILASLEVTYAGQKLLTLFLSGPMRDLQRKLVAPRTGASTRPGAPPMKELMDAAQELTSRVTTWEAVRAVPFIVASGLLVWISVRIYRGDARALHAARAWSLGALGVVVLSALIQALVIVPATIDYARRIAEMMPAPPTGSAAPPFDIQRFIETATAAMTIASVVAGTIFLSAWPIVLRVWAGKLVDQLAASAEPPA